MNTANLMATAITVSTLLWTGIAEARRDQRDGFNFGATVRVQNDNDSTSSADNQDGAVHTRGTSQAVNPYVGYSTGLFNFGVATTFENRTVSTDEKLSSLPETIHRETESNLKAASIYGRLQFGGVMFMEVGAGMYAESVKVDIEQKSDTSAKNFEGTRNSYELSGTGPGYHMSGGVELPMGNGFFLNAAYTVRIFSLRDVVDGDYGKKSAFEQRRELTFGIAHYLN